MPGKPSRAWAVPDLAGTLGTFTFFTDDPNEPSRSVSGGRFVHVSLENGRATLPLEGPPNTFRDGRRPVVANLAIDIDPDRPVARLATGNSLAVLREGHWSDWMTADFVLVPHLPGSMGTVQGTFRVFFRQSHPRLQIYVSQVNVEPLAPALPISYPTGFSGEVTREAGRFFTLGIPEDTSALRQNALGLGEFEQQIRLVADDEHRLLQYFLRRFEGGLLFFYVSSIDQASHILWNRHEPNLLSIYQRIDRYIGEVASAFPSADLLVMSDRGFTSFDRAVHLNAWLRDRGFLRLETRPTAASPGLDHADWSSTKVYALGLNGLYLNMSRRERHGTVHTGREREALLSALREQLAQWRDPVTGKQVISDRCRKSGIAKEGR